MKKLVWVTTVAQSMGFFRGQLNYLSKYFDLTFIASNENDSTELSDKGMQEGIDVHEIPMKRDISLFDDIMSLCRFIGYFRKVKPDAVHGNTPKGALLTMVAALLTGVKTRIYMCHGLRYQGCVGIKRKILVFMERMTCSCATHVLCVSDGVRNTLADDRICSFSKSQVIGFGSCNGININLFDPSVYSVEEKCQLRSQYGIKEDEFLFIYMGRIVKDKGVNEMIEAFIRYRKENPKVRLMILGVFEDKLNPVNRYTTEIIKGNKEGVVYCGRQSDVKPFLAISQCLLLPSYREGFGLVLMEAGGMGLPVISSDIIGCNNVVNVKENGLLVKPKDTNVLYAKIKTMVEDKKLYQNYCKTTRQSIVKRFEQKVLWDNFLEFYKSVI